MCNSGISFDAELGRLKALHGIAADQDADEHIVRDAAYGQALLVFNPVRDAFLKALEASSKFRNNRAQYYMRFGAARRLEMIFFAYRSLIFTAPANRTKALAVDETRLLTQDLNTIYINISGTLDNFAWALLWEHDPDIATNIRRTKVGLFQTPVIQLPALESVLQEVLKHKEWSADLKARRDPSAHRIPLTILPQGLKADEAEIYNELASRTWEAIGRHDIALAQELMADQEEIGRFVPWFLHDPDEGPIPIYPTVPEDIRHLVEIFDIINSVC